MLCPEGVRYFDVGIFPDFLEAKDLLSLDFLKVVGSTSLAFQPPWIYTVLIGPPLFYCFYSRLETARAQVSHIWGLGWLEGPCVDVLRGLVSFFASSVVGWGGLTPRGAAWTKGLGLGGTFTPLFQQSLNVLWKISDH